ncbi:MAG TPA: helicase DnaB [Epsilonproteobacteria bacterium]|nr:helicase DnaB [Campylobacterota bacterium]
MNTKIANLDYERAILSSIVFNPETLTRVQELGVSAGDFYYPFHGRLFDALEYLYEHGAIEESIIRQHMGKTFDEVAMIDVLAALPIDNIEIYTKKIKEFSQLRDFKRLAHQILQEVDKEESLSNTIHLVHKELERVEEGSSELFNITTLDQVKAEEAEFICKSWLPFPKNTVSLVTAGGGVGKSFLLLQAAMRMIRDEKLKVFMWLSEDALSLSKYRAEMIAKNILESDIHAFTKDLHIAGADSETIHFLEESRAGVEVNSQFYQFKRMLKAYDVIILDPLIAMFGADENNNAHARKFVNLFTRWATKEGKTIIFIHHGTKNSSQSRGASAFVDAVRLVYKIEHIKNDKGEVQEDDKRWIILDKDNNGAKKYLGSIRVKRRIFPQKKSVIEIEYV